MIEPEAYQYIYNENVYSLESKQTGLRNSRVEFYLKEKKHEYTEFINKIISAINLRPEEVGIKLTGDFSSNYTGIAIIFDQDFSSDLGFVRRTGIFKGLANFERAFWPKQGSIQTHSFRFSPVAIWSLEDDFKNTDYDLRSSWEAKFKDTGEIGVGMTNSFTFLFDGFDPTGTDGGIPLPGNQGYHYNSVEGKYESDQRKVFGYALGTEVGRFFNGKRYSVEGGMTLRFQPKVFISLLFNYDQISLPDPYPSADIWLISPKIDVTFSKSIFWSTLVQYSNQRDNLGINSRLQWRFAPLSDLFIVYNDNYFVNSFEPKSRSINLKLTYSYIQIKPRR